MLSHPSVIQLQPPLQTGGSELARLCPLFSDQLIFGEEQRDLLLRRLRRIRPVYDVARLSQTEIAAILGQQLGHPVRAETVPLETWERRARESGLGDYQVEALVKMFRYYQRYGFWGNPSVLSWLLGRSPTTFAAFVERSRCSRN